MDKNVFALLLISGFSVISSLTTRDFTIVRTSSSWLNAQNYCRTNFLDLATMDSIEDITFLAAFLPSSYHMWIGLQRAPEFSWGWSAGDNTLPTYSVWGQGEPGNATPPSRLCGAMYYGYWRSLNCSTPLNFVCQNGTLDVFYLVNLSKSWQDAQMYCRSTYTDLATISSALQQDYTSSLIGDTDTVWVGLFADSWAWSDQGTSSFRYWNSGQMQSPSETLDCAVMDMSMQGRWTSQSCDTQMSFICYHYTTTVQTSTTITHKKKQIVSVKVSLNGKKNLNDPLVKTALLKQIEEKLIAKGMAGYIDLSWREKEGVVFQQVPDTTEKQYGC